MLGRNRRRLGDHAAKVDYREGFIQDVSLPACDAAICSQVLIHNPLEDEFSKVVAKLCGTATRVFLFEDVSTRAVTSPQTQLRSVGSLVAAFNRHGFDLRRQETHQLFTDSIAFVELVRRTGTSG
jgi:hypothetical protein